MEASVRRPRLPAITIGIEPVGARGKSPGSVTRRGKSSPGCEVEAIAVSESDFSSELTTTGNTRLDRRQRSQGPASCMDVRSSGDPNTYRHDSSRGCGCGCGCDCDCDFGSCFCSCCFCQPVSGRRNS